MVAFNKATVTIWQKTRPSECEGSGIAAACKLWEKKCPAAGKITQSKDFPEALKATEVFLKAIALARTKLKGIKKPDVKKQKAMQATDSLMDGWESDIRQYQTELAEAEKALNLKKVLDETYAALTFMFDETFEHLADNLKDMNSALRDSKPDKVELAVKASAKATFTIKNATKTLTKEGFLHQVKSKADSLKLDVELAKARPPAEWSEWKKMVVRYEAAINEAREQIDAAADAADTDSGSQDPQYVTAFKKLVKMYQDNIKAMQAAEAEGKKMFSPVSGLITSAGQLAGDDRDGIGSLTGEVADIADKARKLEAHLRDLAASYRDTTNGTIAKKRKELQPSTEDVNKVLAPLTTRMNDANLRATRVVQQIQQGLVKALKTLDKTTGGKAGQETAKAEGLLQST